MLLLAVISLIGAVASKPQSILPMGYSIVAPNGNPSIFPVPYSTIPAASIPAVIPGSVPGPIHVESIPTAAIPVGSIPAATIPMGSVPAATIPMGSVPATIPLATVPAQTIPLGAVPAAAFPLSSVPAAPIPLSTVPAATFPLGSVPPAAFPVGSVPAASIPIGSPMATIPAAPGTVQMGQNIIYPSLDINMDKQSSVPKPVEDTPEVKKARMDFETAYNKALSATAENTSVFRAKRDIQRVLPYGYNLPYSGYVTPYGHISGAVPSNVLPSNVIHAPYFSHV